MNPFHCTFFMVIGFMVGKYLSSSSFKPYKASDYGEKVRGLRVTGTNPEGSGSKAILILQSGKEIVVAE